MFSFESRVRYSELGADGTLGLEGVVNYLQDCSTFQSEALGVGLDYLKKEHRVWVVSNWQINWREDLYVGDKIRISTWPYAFKGFMGWRNFIIEKDGRRCVEADSLWSYLDTDTLRPVKAPEAVVALYGAEEALPLPPLERKIWLPDDYMEMEPFQVRRYHLDTNGHVNNGKYLTMAAEYLPADFKIGQIRVGYKKSALYGETVYPHVCMMQEDDASVSKIMVDLCDAQGKSYATLEFKRKTRIE